MSVPSGHPLRRSGSPRRRADGGLRRNAPDGGRGRTAPSTRRLRQHRFELIRSELTQVVLILENAAQGLRDGLAVEVLAMEMAERLRPVDRLGHTGRLA